MKPSLCINFAILTHCAIAQAVFQGKIINEETRLPVPYANIGIDDEGIGTLSNEDGTFFIRIPAKNLNDTLQFSAIGFRKKSVPIVALTWQTENSIGLTEEPVLLDEVTITEKLEKNVTFELGNSKISGGVLETDTAFAGRSIALLIGHKTSHREPIVFPLYLERARLRIFKNNLETLKFRVRINALDKKSGAPGRDLLQRSIIAKSAMRKGWLEFDLSKLDLIVTEPFFVTFEQILDFTDRQSIADGFRAFRIEHPDKIRVDTIDFENEKIVQEFSGAIALDLPGTFVAISRKAAESFVCYERDTSFAPWKRVQGIVTATVTLSNQRPSRAATKRR